MAGICLGMAGVDRPDDKDTLRGNVTKIFENAQLEIRVLTPHIIILPLSRLATMPK